jgi:head-tail adaptor
MAGAGSLRDFVTFYRSVDIADGGGGNKQSWIPLKDLVRIRGHLMMNRGSESAENGRVQGVDSGVLRIRMSSASQAINVGDVAHIKLETYEIISIINPDRRERFLEMSVRRGNFEING